MGWVGAAISADGQGFTAGLLSAIYSHIDPSPVVVH